MSTQNQRHCERYDTDVKVRFIVPYNFRTEIDFSLKEHAMLDKYIGFSRNISSHGLCFETNKELKSGDDLWLELHLPNSKELIYMQGRARWCQLSNVVPETPKQFLVGVEITTVEGVDVERTIYFDQKFGICWSELLERVLGSFAQLHAKNMPITVLRGLLKDDEGRFLMLQRSAKSKSWPLKWEFPGGKVGIGEHTTAALKREFLEETSLEITPLKRLLDFSYIEHDRTIDYKIFFVERISGYLAISDEHESFGWFTMSEMASLDISAPLHQVVGLLKVSAANN